MESIIKVENHLEITKTDDEINFEALVNIIKVRWSFRFEFLDLNSNSNYNLLQDLFIKPMLNIFFSFQHVVSNGNEKKTGLNSAKTEVSLSDLELLQGNLYVNKQRNFDKNFLKLTQESTKKINFIEREEKISQNNVEKKNLKRTDSQWVLEKNSQKNLKRKKNTSYDNDSISVEREKSSEKTFTDDEKNPSINKLPNDKKKKQKLKFV